MTSVHPRRARVVLAAGAAVTLLAFTGCGFDPSTVPVPGTTVSGETYSLHLEFANVLNLPPGAKVLADGVQIGNLTGLHITDSAGHALVVADIAVRASVPLPADVTAELRQATPLGDVHIALTTPPGSTAAKLTDGATIPLAHTSQAPQVEDTLAGLATAVGSGAVNDIQDTVRRLNSVLPGDPAYTARIFGVLGADLEDVGGNLQSVDALLNGLESTTRTALDDLPILSPMLTDKGTGHLVDTVSAVVSVFYIFTNLAPVAHQAVWLAPLVDGTDAAAKAVVPMLFGAHPMDLDTPSNLKTLVDLIQNKLIPFAEHGPKVDLVGITGVGGSPVDSTERIIQTLRMIGLVR